MQVPFKSIKAVIPDYKENSVHDFSMSKAIKKWANEEVKVIYTSEQMHKYVIMLDVKNSEAYLPVNYKSIIQAGYGMEKSKYHNRQGVLRYVSQEKITGCKITVNVDCPQCNKKNCNCTTPILIYEVDEYDLMKHPEWMAQTQEGFYSWGKVGGVPVHRHSPDFTLMRPAVNNFSDRRELKYCHYINTGTEVEYWTETDYDGGEKLVLSNIDDCKVLLSYHGYLMDKEGYLMVPDIPEVWETLTYTIDMKKAYKKWMGDYNDKAEGAFMRLKALKQESEMMAKVKLGRIEPAKFKALWMNFFGKQIPHYYVDETAFDYQNDTYRPYK